MPFFCKRPLALRQEVHVGLWKNFPRLHGVLDFPLLIDVLLNIAGRWDRFQPTNDRSRAPWISRPRGPASVTMLQHRGCECHDGRTERSDRLPRISRDSLEFRASEQEPHPESTKCQIPTFRAHQRIEISLRDPSCSSLRGA